MGSRSNFAHPRTNAAGNVVSAAEFIEHCPLNPAIRVGVERCAPSLAKAAQGLVKSQHPCLDEVGILDVGRQAMPHPSCKFGNKRTVLKQQSSAGATRC
jgi:hypothetical protein